MVYVWRHQRPAYRTIQHVTRSCLSADPTRRVSRPAIGMLGACRRWHLARLALGLSLQCLLGGLRFRSRECGRRCTSLNYLRPLTGLSRNHCLEGGNRLFQLLIGQALNPGRMLELHLLRHEQRAYFHVRCRLRPAHTLNRLRAALPKVSQQGRNELAIQLLAMTRADRTAGSGFAISSGLRGDPCACMAVGLCNRSPVARRSQKFPPMKHCEHFPSPGFSA